MFGERIINMKMNEAKISLIIPVYNVKKYLSDCLETAINQTYTNYEIILIDDGSTDGSSDLCREYELKYENIRVIYKKQNEGLMSAWQSGVMEAEGEYIAFLDSDDWIDSQYLEQLSQGINFETDVVCCNAKWEYETFSVFHKEILPEGLYDSERLKNEVYPIMLNNGTYLGRGVSPNRWGKLIRKSLLLSNICECKKEISYGEDLNIIFPVMLDCEKLLVLDDRIGLYHYRQNQQSIIHGYKKNMFRQICLLRECLMDIQKKKNKFDFTEQINLDFTYLFYEYAKNETKAKNRWDAVNRVRSDYEYIKKTKSHTTLDLKVSDKVLMLGLEHDCRIIIYIWFVFYALVKRCMKISDWKALWSPKIKKSDKSKVLMVGPDLSVKGGMKTVVNQYLSSKEWKNTELIYVPTYIEKNNIVKLLFFVKQYSKILGICMKKNVSLMHIHVSERGSFWRKAAVLLLGKKAGIPTVLHHHGAEFVEFYENAKPWIKQKIVSIINAADVNIVLSDYQLQRMEKLFPEARFQVLYNGIEIESKNHYKGSEKGILFVGRLGKRKGVYDLLEALKNIDDQLGEDVKVYLCGDGEVAHVKETIKSLKLSHRIGHVGWCSKQELQELYEKTGIYVLPSYHEGLPMALLEAMSYGIPCISCCIDAIPEVLETDTNGILIHPGNIEELQNAILKLINNDIIRRNMSKQAYHTVCSQFSISEKIIQLENLYSNMKERENYDY